jgi:hypothetical protein
MAALRGSIAEAVPHVTVTDGVRCRHASAVQAELERGLPVYSEFNDVALLLQDETGRWNLARTWPLGGADWLVCDNSVDLIELVNPLSPRRHSGESPCSDATIAVPAAISQPMI